MSASACCFIGHREIPADQIPELRKRLNQYIYSLYCHGNTIFYTGCIPGFDTLAADAVIDCRSTFRDIRLVAVVPCKNQGKYWRAEDIQRYYCNLGAADDVLFLSSAYYPGCMQRRNCYMVDHSDVCICYQTKNAGGTAYAVQYAREQGLKIHNLA